MRKLRFRLSDISKYKNEIYGISIIWIMLFHAVYNRNVRFASIFAFLSPLDGLLSHGNMGVDIFLLCSGIFLYFSYAKKRKILPYMKRRLLRLFLPVFIIYGWLWFVQYVILEFKPFVFLLKISTLDFWVTGDSLIWFVPFLLVCYIVYPYIFEFLFGDGGRRTQVRYIILMILSIALTLILRYAAYDIYYEFKIAVTRLPIFITGCFLGKFVYEKETLPGWVSILMIGLTVAVFVILYLQPFMGYLRRWLYSFGALTTTGVFILILRFLNLGRSANPDFGVSPGEPERMQHSDMSPGESERMQHSDMSPGEPECMQHSDMSPGEPEKKPDFGTATDKSGKAGNSAEKYSTRFLGRLGGLISDVLAFFGKISLNLYLSHLMLRAACEDIFSISLDKIWKYFVIALLSVLVAWAAELLISVIRKNPRSFPR